MGSLGEKHDESHDGAAATELKPRARRTQHASKEIRCDERCDERCDDGRDEIHDGAAAAELKTRATRLLAEALFELSDEPVGELIRDAEARVLEDLPTDEASLLRATFESKHSGHAADRAADRAAAEATFEAEASFDWRKCSPEAREAMLDQIVNEATVAASVAAERAEISRAEARLTDVWEQGWSASEDVSSTIDAFNIQPFLDKAAAGNQRHCLGIAFVPREGSECPGPAAASSGWACPSGEASTALNGAFFAGEDAPALSVMDRTLRQTGRIEDGGHFLVSFEEELSCASLSLDEAGAAGAAGAAASTGGAAIGGAYAEQTARGVLLLVYGAGMDAQVAKQLTTGLQEALVAEGM